MTKVTATPPVPFYRLYLRMGGWVSMAFAASYAVLAVISSDMLDLSTRFEREGREAGATVEERYTRTSRDSDGKTTRHYHVVLTFETDAGEIVEVDRSVDRSVYQTISETEPLPLEYLESEPQRTEITPREHRSAFVVTKAIALAFGVLTLGGLWYSASHATAAVWARRHGTREPAEVTGIKRTNVRINKKYRIRLTWREKSGRAGESLMYSRHALENIPLGSEIHVYQGRKRAWWTGDVGERPTDT